MHRFNRRKLANNALNNLDRKDNARAIAAYLIESGKTSEVNSLARDIMQIRQDAYGVAEVTAISAHKLDSELRNKITGTIKSATNAKKVIIDEQIDPAVVGGVRLELANSLLDNTVDARLNALREKVTA